MKFAAKQDIEAPIARVFAALTDFEMFERAALRRGADVSRLTEITPPGVGVSWYAGFVFRGRPRKMRIEVIDFDVPHCLTLSARSATLEGRLFLDLVDLSRTRTRLSVDLDLQPHTMSGRLLLQSMRLAHARLTRRFRLRVTEFALDIEDRHRRRA